MIWNKVSLIIALMASPIDALDETPTALSISTQESLAFRTRNEIEIPDSSEVVYIRTIGTHHVRTEFSTIAWLDKSGNWIVSRVGEDGPGGLLKIEPRLITETVRQLSVSDSRKLDKLLRSNGLYNEQIRRSGTLGVGAPTHQMEIVSSRGTRFVEWDGRLKGKAGRVADIVLNH